VKSQALKKSLKEIKARKYIEIIVMKNSAIARYIILVY